MQNQACQPEFDPGEHMVKVKVETQILQIVF